MARCPKCKITLRSGADVCRICGTAIERKPTLDSRLGLDDRTVRQGLIITTSLLIGCVLLSYAVGEALDNMERQAAVDAEAARAQEARADDPTLPVRIGDFYSKVAQRCGPPARMNESEGADGKFVFIEYEGSQDAPSDCVGHLTFLNHRLARTYR